MNVSFAHPWTLALLLLLPGAVVMERRWRRRALASTA